MRGIYWNWALLPLSLFLLVAWALYKRIFKVAGREYPKDYLREATYTTLLLLLSVGFDKALYLDLIDKLTGDTDTIMIVRWLIYPFVLFAAALGYDSLSKRRQAKHKQLGAKKPRPPSGKPANF